MVITVAREAIASTVRIPTVVDCTAPAVVGDVVRCGTGFTLSAVPSISAGASATNIGVSRHCGGVATAVRSDVALPCAVWVSRVPLSACAAVIVCVETFWTGLALISCPLLATGTCAA